MKVVFLKKFSKDLDKINRSDDLNSILEIIELVKSADQISEVPGVKKLVGFNDAFRLRTGDYRIGVFVSRDQVEFARVAHRKDIYKVFP
ncbi:MAG: type II toxin-antitoxin system RelE/ParE family toxin [Cyclobacteriaceae bacterium]